MAQTAIYFPAIDYGNIESATCCVTKVGVIWLHSTPRGKPPRAKTPVVKTPAVTIPPPKCQMSMARTQLGVTKLLIMNDM